MHLPARCQVAPLWFLAQLTFNLSLSRTSVTSNTILSSTSALFTFLLAVALLSEAFTLTKMAFIMLVIAGEWAGCRLRAVVGGWDGQTDCGSVNNWVELELGDCGNLESA